MTATRDLITGLVCLIASLVLLALTIGLPGPSLLVPVGPGFYPRIILGITALLSAILVGQSLYFRRREASTADTEKPRRNYRLVAITFGIFGVYVVLLPYLGYRVSTLAFVAALQATLETPRGAKAWLLVAIVALATTAVTYYTFEFYLSVLLPRGRWIDF